MNIPFNIKGGDEKLTDKFLIQSWNEGMVGLRTLTPFGVGEYLRASLYNGSLRRTPPASLISCNGSLAKIQRSDRVPRWKK